MTLFGADWGLYLALIVVGFLPSEVWRLIGLVVGGRVDETSEVFIWVRAVATATLAAVVVKLGFYSGGTLAEIPILIRAIALGLGVLIYFGARRSVLAGVLVGEAVLIGAAIWLGA